MKKTFLVAGGDLRQLYVAEMLAEKYTVYAIGFDKALSIPKNVKLFKNRESIPESVTYMVLPIPVSNDGIMLSAPFSSEKIPLAYLAELVSDNGTVFGGKFDESSKKAFASFNIDTIDYLCREELSVLNAVPTAEGAVAIAIEETPKTIYGQKILITGFGRISRVLAEILIGMGADVTVSARKCSDLAWAEIAGCKTIGISSLKENISGYGIIFNTVPALILTENILQSLNRDCLVIDLASKPGGVDFETARQLGVKTIWALSLPGKTAPVTSGHIIAKTILNILKERGEPIDS